MLYNHWTYFYRMLEVYKYVINIVVIKVLRFEIQLVNSQLT